MRWGALAITALLAGCAAKGRELGRAPQTVAPEYDERAVAAALVFDAPVTFFDPPLRLPREEREPHAFVGFDQSITTFSYVRTDDRQTDDFDDRYQRRSISEKFGFSSR